MGQAHDRQVFAEGGAVWLDAGESAAASDGPFCFVKAFEGDVDIENLVMGSGVSGAPSTLSLSSGQILEGWIISLDSSVYSTGKLYCVKAITHR